MTKDETILEIMKDYPAQKIGLDDFYGRQTVINMLNKAINFTHCCMELKDKEALTFEGWLISNKYEKYINGYAKGLRHYGETELIEKYKNEITAIDLTSSLNNLKMTKHDNKQLMCIRAKMQVLNKVILSYGVQK